MKDLGKIQGSAAQAQPLIVGRDTVYVHTNIEPVTEDQEGNPVTGLYEYNETQYDKDEYIKLISEQMESTQEAIDFLLFGED